MSRPIKFRAWQRAEKRWLEIDTIRWESGSLVKVIELVNYGVGGESILGKDVPMRELKAHDISEVDVVEFTGLHDKHGTEIWEGDVVKYWYEDFPWEVVWQEDVAMFWLEAHGERVVGDLNAQGDPEICIDWERTEVLGNIYEQPDLLTGTGTR